MANRKKKPTRACWEFLERVRKASKGTPPEGYVMAVTSPDTMHVDALRARGWIKNHMGPFRYVITALGEEELARQKTKMQAEG